MVTQRGAALLIGAALLWLVGRSLGVPELYVAAAGSAVLVGAAALAVRLGSTTVAVRRHVEPRRLLCGGNGEVRLDLRNDARWDTTALLLVEDACHQALVDRPPRFAVAGLRPRRTTKVRYTLQGTRRGRFTVGPMRVRVRDPFGLVERIRQYTETAELLVYPRIEPLATPVSQGAHRGSESSDVRRLLNAGDEFYTMREYATGDDLRLVHWPSTARRQRLMVRQHELPWQAQATIVCDTRTAAHRGVGQESTLERALSVAASLVWHLADHSYQLRLLTEAGTASGAGRAGTASGAGRAGTASGAGRAGTASGAGRAGTALGVTPWSTLLDRLATAETTSAARLGPALLRLRSAGAEGLLAAVLAGGLNEADLRALIHAGRSFNGRIAIVIDLERPGPAETVALLRASGWRAALLPRDRPLADAWRELATARRRAPAGAAG